MAAMSPSRTTTPLSERRTGTACKSSTESRYPVARTMYSASAISITPPPASWLAAVIARCTVAREMPYARSRFGSTMT